MSSENKVYSLKKSLLSTVVCKALFFVTLFLGEGRHI